MAFDCRWLFISHAFITAQMQFAFSYFSRCRNSDLTHKTVIYSIFNTKYHKFTVFFNFLIKLLIHVIANENLSRIYEIFCSLICLNAIPIP